MFGAEDPEWVFEYFIIWPDPRGLRPLVASFIPVCDGASAATRCDGRRRRSVLFGTNAPPSQFLALTIRLKDVEPVQRFQFPISPRVSSVAEARSGASPGDALVPSLCRRGSSCLKFSLCATKCTSSPQSDWMCTWSYIHSTWTKVGVIGGTPISLV